jgi:hypothetical protein
MPQFHLLLHGIHQHISYHILRITETVVMLFRYGINKLAPNTYYWTELRDKVAINCPC